MVDGISHLFTKTGYPDVAMDAVGTLVARPGTMIPFESVRFPELLSEFEDSFATDALVDSAMRPAAENDRLLDMAGEVERYVATRLWRQVLDPCLEEVSSEVIAVPTRDTLFDSAVYRDQSVGWKVEAYLYTADVLPDEIRTIHRAKRDYLRSLENGVVPTAESMAYRLTEIKAKGDLFGYPSCCTDRFLQERRTRFEALLEVGDDRIAAIRRDASDSQEAEAIFARELESRGISMGDLNPESRVIDQLERIDVRSYFEGWDYKDLLSFFRRKSSSEPPAFFYAFFSDQFYPHRPRCEEAVSIGRLVERELEEAGEELVAAYRCAIVLNLTAQLGFDDRSTRRRLLADVIAEVGGKR